MFVKKRRTMFPKSTFEIVIDEEILYFKDVWAYMDSGIRGDVISSSEPLELEWDENFENVTTKCDDNLWISYKVPYIKHCWDGIKRMQKLSEMNESYCDRVSRNEERKRVVREKLRIKQKKKVQNLGAEQYKKNASYRVKVNTLFSYAIAAKYLHYSMFINRRYSDFKAGLYLSCLAFSFTMELNDKKAFEKACFEFKA